MTVQIHLADLDKSAFNDFSACKKVAPSSDAKEFDSVLKGYSAKVKSAKNAGEYSNKNWGSNIRQQT